jgi:hypothetical protein
VTDEQTGTPPADGDETADPAAASDDPAQDSDDPAAASDDASAASGEADQPPDDAELSSVRAVPYKGEELDAERGPGLGCFRFQLVVLAFFVVLTPIGVTLGWPDWLSGGMLLLVIVLLFFTGQTMIFLMRLVAADRRGRRRPMAGATPTVGQIEDAEAHDPLGDATATSDDGPGGAQDDEPTVRQ